uniref:Uncharacterized protein n=1 Tax=Globodera rostochiensis TaxID=31243 RepID=A0A914HWM8_GLORO
MALSAYSMPPELEKVRELMNACRVDDFRKIDRRRREHPLRRCNGSNSGLTSRICIDETDGAQGGAAAAALSFTSEMSLMQAAQDQLQAALDKGVGLLSDREQDLGYQIITAELPGHEPDLSLLPLGPHPGGQREGGLSDFDPGTPSRPNNARGQCTNLSGADYPRAEGSPGAREEQQLGEIGHKHSALSISSPPPGEGESLIGAAAFESPPSAVRRIWPPPTTPAGKGAERVRGKGALKRQDNSPLSLWLPAPDQLGTLATDHNCG